ncbi:C39 family peptidase [Brachybacterium kimchii]|uniref:C39 family peptidase n=1 Tax=Brachybacterium kimchii TaxID=2942909 RepID=A0ABY4N920_9MICO|nr:C39 family peptidase [Brachybacterium kimchii]UQN29695.1 C39 family peptidase [Brachybacterium kimchii]
MLDRRTLLHRAGLSALALSGIAAAAPVASAATSKNLPTTWQQQETVYWCGPTAVAVALSALGDAPSPAALADELGTTQAGTNFGAVSPVLTAHSPGAAYRDQWMESTTASEADADLLWERATANVDDGFATVLNWWVMPGEYPDWGGNTGEIFHFVAVDGYDPDERTLRIADPAGTTLSADLPQHHQLPVQQVATYCAGRGYFW